MSVFKHGINQIRFRGIEEAGKHRSAGREEVAGYADWRSAENPS